MRKVANAFSHCIQAASRLATLYMETGVFSAAESVFTDLEVLLAGQSSDLVEVKRRALDARLNAAQRKHADYYKLLGLQRSCSAEEVRAILPFRIGKA